MAVARSRRPVRVVPSGALMPQSITSAGGQSPHRPFPATTGVGLAPAGAFRRAACAGGCGGGVAREQQQRHGRPTCCQAPTWRGDSEADAAVNQLETAFGAAGTANGSMPFMAMAPMLNGWKPSTSLLISMAFRTARSSMCAGKGSCTKIPWNAGSAL